MSVFPDFDLGPKANAFRQEVRAWLAQHWTEEQHRETHKLPVWQRGINPRFSKELGEQGWIALAWPKEWGGQERSAYEQLAFAEEMNAVDAPTSYHTCARDLVAPALIVYGTQEQKEEWLPKIRSGQGRIMFCLGYSEPSVGSDLAALQTKAVKDGNEWVITGSKLFTTMGPSSHYIWLAARTDPNVPKHAGISVFMVPLDSPGITINPMTSLSEHQAASIFFDEVRVPANALVGEANIGWKILNLALANERILMGSRSAMLKRYFEKLLAYVAQNERNGKPMRDDPEVKAVIGRFGAEIEAARILALYSIEVLEQGKVPLTEAAMSKVYTGELEERLAMAALELLGPGATLNEKAPSPVLEGIWDYALRDSMINVIGGGTAEIQRNLIAIRGLGLPR